MIASWSDVEEMLEHLVYVWLSDYFLMRARIWSLAQIDETKVSVDSGIHSVLRGDLELKPVSFAS